MGMTYIGIQQNIRQSANDPQIQMAEDAAIALGKGVDPTTLVGARSGNNDTLAPFMIVADNNYKVLATSWIPDDLPPVGSLTYAKEHGHNYVTWSPAHSSLRMAAVILPFNGEKTGYVIAARNLRAVEERKTELTQLFAMGWAVMAVLVIAATFLVI
jgi:hypothetical protein